VEILPGLPAGVGASRVFGDQIEALYRTDPLTGKKIEKIEVASFIRRNISFRRRKR
jgi:hypothetical protein